MKKQQQTQTIFYACLWTHTVLQREAIRQTRTRIYFDQHRDGSEVGYNKESIAGRYFNTEKEAIEFLKLELLKDIERYEKILAYKKFRLENLENQTT
jgi:hypothetical protein